MATVTNIPKVEDLRDLVDFLREKNVKRFCSGGIEIEIDTVTAAIKHATPDELDAEVARTKKLFESSPEDQQRLLFWSTPDQKA